MDLGFEADALSPRVVPPVLRRNEASPPRPGTGVGGPVHFLDSQRCPELDCVARLLPAATAAAARARAASVGVGADRVLITTGHLNEETYLRALGENLGVGFEPLDDIPRACFPVDEGALIDGAATGLLPLSADDDLAVVVAPRERAARRLIAMLQANPALARRFRFTTAERLNRFVMRHAGRAIAARATNRLQETFPALSAGPRRISAIPSRLSLAGVAALAGTIIAPTAALHVMAATLATLFLAWLGLRFAAAFIPTPQMPLATMSDRALPVYSVIAALYRESASVDGLLHAIERLDYPALGSKCTKCPMVKNR